MAEAVAVEFESPSGEPLRFEWRSELLEGLVGVPDPGSDPPWRLGGELDWDQLEAVRVLSGRLDDGRLLALAALRPAGAAGHGDELVAGSLRSDDVFEQLERALISVEYDGAGEPMRLGLELYRSEASIAIRIAGDAESTASAREGGLERRSAAFALRSMGAAGTAVLDRLKPA